MNSAKNSKDVITCPYPLERNTLR